MPVSITKDRLRSNAIANNMVNDLSIYILEQALIMEFNVSTLDNAEQAKNLKETILTSEPNANVNIDLDSKKVTIKSEASAETFKQLIVAAGHKVS